MITPDIDGVSWLRILIAISIVSSLLAGLGLGLRYISQNQIRIPGLKYDHKRLSVLETLPLDVKRRLVLIRCDDNEHLLLIGSNQDIVITTNLTTQNEASLKQKD